MSRTGRLLLPLHLGLAAAVGLVVLDLGLATGVRAALAVLALVPLALCLPGLVAGRAATLRWLSVVLVLYAGVGSVEVIAAGTRASVALLLLALLELALALIMLRRGASR